MQVDPARLEMRIDELRRTNLRKLIDDRFQGVAAPLAKRLDLQPSYMSRLFTKNEDHRRNIGDEMARKIEGILGLPDGWMDTTHDSPRNIPSSSAVVPKADNSIAQLIQEGEDRGVRSVHVTETWMYRHLGIANTKDVAIVTATGDAMAGTFADGDVLFVDRSHDTVKTDAIYALTMHGEFYIRRVQRQPDGDLTLIADNSVYAPQVVTKRERASMAVLGRVIGAWRWQRL